MSLFTRCVGSKDNLMPRLSLCSVVSFANAGLRQETALALKHFGRLLLVFLKKGSNIRNIMLFLFDIILLLSGGL